MGVSGLTPFLFRNDYFENYRLYDTLLIVDGFNFIYQLFFEYQRKINDHMYGGDYGLYANTLKKFFTNLQKCNVKPIVIFDGSIDPSLEKLETLLHRVESNLNSARKIYENNFYTEGILPMLACSTYCLQLKKLQIPVYQTSFEADETIIQMAYDLKCPILSNDSDFYLCNLPGGVINLKSVFDFDCTIQQDNFRYVRCKIFKVNNLKRSFPNLNLDLIQIIGFILGNDYIDSEIATQLIKKISQYNDRQKIIRDIFKWISKFRSLESLLQQLSTLLKNPEHRIVKIIEKHFIQLQNTMQNNGDNEEKEGASTSINIDEYFQNNLENLLLKNVQIPEWIRPLYIRREINRIVLSVSKARIDWCRPLVEDFSFEQSTYEVAADLMQYIYGILCPRNDTNNVDNLPKIKKYSRYKLEFRSEKISPIIKLNSEQYLPKLEELEKLEQKEREALFFKILKIDEKIFEEIQNHLTKDNAMKHLYDYHLLIPFTSMLICLLFMMQNFNGDIWIEFIYSIYMNIWLTGYLCSESNAMFLKLDQNLRQILKQNFNKLSQQPILSCSKVFMPRVVHFYNCYQVCLERIECLSEILNVKNLFNIDVMYFALKGTFLYNLTVDLSSRPKPLLFMEQLLQRKQFPVLDTFQKLLDYLMENSGRSVLNVDDNDETLRNDKYIVPDSLRKRIVNLTDDNYDEDDIENTYHLKDASYLVRSFDVTNKKTHIKSQKMKLLTKKKK